MLGPYSNDIYHATSIGQMNIPWEIEFDESQKALYLFDVFALEDEATNDYLEATKTYKIGENLISFFELDLKKYNKSVDKFYSEYRKSHILPEKIDFLDLDHFIDNLDFYHPYFFSLDTVQLSRLHWDDAYNALKIDLNKAYSLYDLICGLCNNKGTMFVSTDIKPIIDDDPKLNWLVNVDNIMDELFCQTATLKQRLHYNVTMNATKQSIHDVKLKYRYYNINPFSFCITEFYKVLELHIPIRYCKNCKKLFIPETNHAADYCNRPYLDTGLTCKKIGAAAQYRSKVNQNPILKEYTKAYKRNYARVTNKKMSSEQFRIWNDEATKKRNTLATEYESNPSDQLVIDFKRYLGNK